MLASVKRMNSAKWEIRKLEEEEEEEEEEQNEEEEEEEEEYMTFMS